MQSFLPSLSIHGPIKVLRRLISILLLAVVGLPFLAPLIAYGQEVKETVPACCRRNGKHHCLMSMGERSQLQPQQSAFHAPYEKCPYHSGVLVPTRPTSLYPPSVAASIYAGLVSHPTGVAQTNSLRRIARDRSRLKRGPPSRLTT